MVVSKQKNINVNTMVSDQYEIFFVKDQVDQSKTLYHTHDFYEIHCTLHGNAYFFLGGRQIILEEGSILLIHPQEIHRIIRQTTDCFERVYIFLTPEFLQNRSTKQGHLEACFESTIGHLKSRVLKINLAHLMKYMGKLKKQPDKKCFGSDIFYEQQLIDFIIYLNQLVLQDEHTSITKYGVENKRIEAIIEYISTNLDQPLTLAEIEKAFFVSKYYVMREFKKYTGFTLHQFILNRRLAYAKQLLKEQRQASEIFAICGFKSYSHFLKCFKREFNLTPKEFLKQNKSNQMLYFDHYHQ